MKGLGETITQSTVVQKVLRTLPLRFNPKALAIEDREKLDDLTLQELHGILVFYEMRIRDPSQKEVAFKVTKDNYNNECCPSDNGVSDEELANFVNKILRGTRRYKGKLPLKCFNFGKIGHFAAKCPLNNRQKQINPRRNFGDRIFGNKQTMLTKL